MASCTSITRDSSPYRSRIVDVTRPLDITIMGPDRTGLAMLLDLYLVRFFLIYLFVPCGGLSWLYVSFLLHVKFTISHRNIVPYLTTLIDLLCIN